MKKYVALALLGILSILLVVVFSAHRYFHSPYDHLHTDKVFVIKRGECFRGICSGLARAGVLRYPWFFNAVVSTAGFDLRSKAGQYLFHSSMTPLEILDALTKGLVVAQCITVPEGFTIEQIGELLEKEGVADKTAILEASRDPQMLKAMKISAYSMEGYLFPDSYHMYQGMPPENIVKAMVRRFREVMTPQIGERINEMGLSLHEVVTLASIIEKETSLETERPLVASVLMNRLKKAMPLQSDPTVIYCLVGFDGNLTREHLDMPVLYNTYVFKGLPPGPIANPGLASIQAVLYPAKTSYLYFVSRNDGSHEFSENIKKHDHAVSRYQKGRNSTRAARRLRSQ